MKIDEIAKKLELVLQNNAEPEYREAGTCYIGDLLSHAMSRLSSGDVWITVQTNINTAAIALLADAGCIILPDGIEPDGDTVKKADDEGIPIYSSSKTAYRLAGELSELGI